MIAKFHRSKSIHYAWVLLAACCVFQLALQGVFNYCSGIFYVSVSKSLGVSIGAFSVSSTIYGLSMGFFSPLAGKMFSKKYMGLQMAVATAIMCAVFMLLSLANAVWQWYLAMAVIGACGSFLLIIPIPILINNWFDKNAGIALAITAAFSGLSGAIVSPVGTKIILSFGWRNAYLILGAMAAALSIPIFLLFVCNNPEQVNMKPYGYDPSNVARAQQLGKTENVRFIMDKKAVMVLLSAGMLCIFKSYYNHFSAFAVSIGLDEMTGASLMSLVMLGTVFLRLFLGLINDKAGIYSTVNVSLVLTAVSLIGLAFFCESKPLLMISTFAMGIGPAMMSVLPPLLTAAIYDRAHYSKVFPVVTLASTLASSLSNSIFGFMYDIYASYVPALVLGAALTIVCFLAVRKTINGTR